ncbi:2-oxoglutarate-Fe(II) type oxidoreductase [Canna indica]|uniref:2-oxoglutarate-Fe(II) type oxidoreductase n=1 Tax=Canna indica TaxID=4628 RepID=A0AAQ3KLN0_9LILI|nr:2-oxoglutarate-Fe(II) type oxidoreductase [Canna indica]
MSRDLVLPIIDLASPDRDSIAQSIRQACVEYGFFYVINHGIPKGVFQKVFEESKKFFALPLEEKLKLKINDTYRGYTPSYSGNDEDLKESFYLSSGGGSNSETIINQWPPEETLPLWRVTMESYCHDILTVGKRLSSLIALSLNLDDQYFEKVGAFVDSSAVLRLLHYPDEVSASDAGKYGVSPHSDFGMLTLLAINGVPGLQICREKDKCPQLWEDVHHVDGSLIVNIGDLLERWTNCVFRSTLHRVLAIGKERYSVALFLDANADCLIECLESCCSETCPPRFPPIRSGDHLRERLQATFLNKTGKQTY